MLAAAFIIYAVPAYRQKAVKVVLYSICDSPVPYKIGSIDQRFGLSRDEALVDSETATDLWSTAEGKKLFVNSPKAQLTVNFVYDQRQALDSQITQLNTSLHQKSSTLQQQVASYKAQVASFEQRLNAFNEKVDGYNKQGGAPHDVYENLIKEQKALQAEGDALNVRAKELNLSTNDYNADVSALNQDVSQFNSALSQKPEEGIYDSGSNTITIYFASNHQELLHTLAHEFGHALGMNHVKDPQGIMYPNTTSSFSVSFDDNSQLAYACREQSLFIHLAQVFDLWLFGLIHK